MERRGNKVDIVQRVSCWISDMAFARFKSFSDRVLGIQIDEIPTVESILMRQNFSVVFYAAILFILTNGMEENTMRRRRGLRCWPTMGW